MKNGSVQISISSEYLKPERTNSRFALLASRILNSCIVLDAMAHFHGGNYELLFTTLF